MQIDSNNFDAVIFDLDGVLLNTEPVQYQGWVEALKPFKIKLSKEKYLDYAGKTGAIIEKEIMRDFGLKAKPGPLLQEKEKLLLKWFSEKEIELMPFAKEAVEYFSKKGFKLAVCSGGPRNEIELKLKRTGLLKFFKNIISRDDVQRGKPFPDIYLKAVEKLGSKKNKCIAIEDSQYGIESAKGAGIKCFAVLNEFSEKQDLSKADKVFNNLKEIIDWFEQDEN